MNQQYNFFSINEDQSGSRLDRVLHKTYPYLTQGIIEKSLRKKLITVNQQKSSANYRVQANDYIQISSQLINEDYQGRKDKKQIDHKQLSSIIDSIIYRDGNLIAINKPAGLAVQGGSGIKISVDDIIPEILETFGTWSDEVNSHKLVHRLDKETSGILLIALNNRTAQELAHAFKTHLVEKKYLAIVKGHLKVNNGQISSVINKEQNKNIKQDNAITNYKVLAKKSKASFVEFRPITGKTHQLRLHSLELGFPILGDSKYDPEYQNDSAINLHLHAAEISFPYQGTILKLSAEPPEYFKKSLKEIFKL